MSNLNIETKQINGPVNVLRLEGKINKIKKVIYLFLDIHVGLQEQTSCENIFALDIQQYLVKNFLEMNKSDQMYDFFFEIYPRMSQKEKSQSPNHPNYRDIYIREIVKVFQKIFSYDATKNKVLSSNIFKNVRLHYMDIRDYFEVEIREKIYEVSDIVDNTPQFTVESLGSIISISEEIKEEFEFILDAMILPKKSKNLSNVRIIRTWNEIDEQSEKLSQKERDEMTKKYMNYLINKIFISYNNPDIQKKMLKHFDYIKSDLESVIDKCNIMIDALKKIGNKYRYNQNRLTKDDVSGEYNYNLSPHEINDMNNFIVNTWLINSEIMVDFFTRFMDVYFLRRFLDKDYITNGIAYTGSYHSDVYISILVKDFNFKVTHFSYSKITDLDKLNLEIKKRSILDLGELFLPPFFSQCSDVKHFPEGFK